MKTQEEQVQEKISILISNIKDALIETKEMVDLMGDEKVKTKRGHLSLNDMFDFSKMDIDGFIAYIFFSKQNEKVFGDLSFELVSIIFCSQNPVVSKKIMNSLVKSLLN